MQGSDREGGELPLLEGAFLSGFVRLLYQCTWLCRRGIKIPKRYHESGKLLEEWPGDDSGAALIQIDLWMSMLRLGNKLCARASLRRQRQHFALCVPAFFFAPHQTGGGGCFLVGETEEKRSGGEGRGNIPPGGKKNIPITRGRFFTVWSLVEEIVLGSFNPYSSWITRSGNILFIVLLFLSSKDNEIMCLDYTLIHTIPRIVKMLIGKSELREICDANNRMHACNLRADGLNPPPPFFFLTSTCLQRGRRR